MDFSNLFSNFTSTDSIALMILWVLAFLFGILLGSVLRGGTIRRLRKELETKQSELIASQGEVTRLTDELHLREADLRKTQFEVEEHKSKSSRLTDEKTKLYNEIYALGNEVETLRKAAPVATDAALVADLNTTIDGLNNEISALQTRNQLLEEELAQLRTATPMEIDLTQPETETTVDYLAEFQSMQNALRTRLETLENKLNRLEGENDELRTEVQALKTADAPLSMERAAILTAPAASEAEPIWNLGSTETPRQILVESDTIQKDDLTRIDGIGPFLERQLNESGIYTYEQISRWDGSDIHQVTQQIRYFPGRIEREDWVGQANRLMEDTAQPRSLESYEEDTIPLSANAHYPADHTDLTVIEGVGPRIEELLREAGINTWDELAEADLDRLSEILDAQNLSFHNPATWTAQARLAAGGHWELLKEYQEQLRGGRDDS
jgi:predicted flap endonuclease-1-like 5' DNA nuclease